MNESQKKQIREYRPEIEQIGIILRSVKETGEMPRNMNHLYSRYHNQGLIKMQTKKTPLGGTIYGKIKLTEKGRRMLKLIYGR